MSSSSEVGGGESDREISMVPACVILRLGIRSEDSAPRSRARARARVLGFVVLLYINIMCDSHRNWIGLNKMRFSRLVCAQSTLLHALHVMHAM